MTTMSWLIDGDDSGDSLKRLVKQCVAVEYIPVSDVTIESSINVLIQHKDSFEWMDIQHAIPAGSAREYSPPSPPTIAKLK